MGSLDPRAYASIFKARQAYRFDAGALLMRLFSYTTTMGTIAMLTMSGASALGASSVASFIAICMFVVAPRVSKRIDERGQSAVVPAATVIAMAGFALMLATTCFGLPFWLNYVAAPFISFLPNAQALARTRWTFLISSGRLGQDAPPLKTAYAYEGILEDVAFMVGPAAVIALSATVVPIAGPLVGCIVYCLGAALLISSKQTEPEPGWDAVQHRDPASSAPREADADLPEAPTEGAPAAAQAPRAAGASVLRTSPVVRLLFVSMVLFGSVYGAFDTAAISYSESIGFAALASIVFAVESLFSVVVSFLFGMVGIAAPLRKQFVAFAVVFGCLYTLLAFVNSPMSLIAISCIAGLSYAPMFITSNITCERAVPSENLTEAISWLASGQSIGMVIGPVSAGAMVDAFGPLAGFDLAACYAVGVIVLALASIPVLRKHLQ